MDVCRTETPALAHVGPNHRVACFLVSENSVGVQHNERAAV
jgi:hypothetical protein